MDNDLENRIDEEIRLEDFPEAYRAIVKAVGIPAAIKIAKESGGLSQYIPKYDALLQPARDRLILQDFTGYNYRELALKYNLSEIWVRQIVDKDKAAKAKDEYLKNQIGLDFGEGGKAS